MSIQRFIDAHYNGYNGYSNFKQAHEEIKKNKKKITHWMWYIFPQIDGLGKTNMSTLFSIKTIEEAKSFLDNNIVGSNLKEITNSLLKIEGKTLDKIFGDIDSTKLLSSMTLFSKIYELTKNNKNNNNNIFKKVIEKYNNGVNDQNTIIILEIMISQNQALQNQALQKKVLQNQASQKQVLQKKVLQNQALQKKVLQNQASQKQVLQKNSICNLLLKYRF